MPGDGIGTSIVCGEGQLHLAKPVQLLAQVPSAAEDILQGVERVRHAQCPGRGWHELHQALSSCWGDAARVVVGLSLDDSMQEGRIETRAGSGLADDCIQLAGRCGISNERWGRCLDLAKREIERDVSACPDRPLASGQRGRDAPATRVPRARFVNRPCTVGRGEASENALDVPDCGDNGVDTGDHDDGPVREAGDSRTASTGFTLWAGSSESGRAGLATRKLHDSDLVLSPLLPAAYVRAMAIHFHRPQAIQDFSVTRRLEQLGAFRLLRRPCIGQDGLLALDLALEGGNIGRTFLDLDTLGANVLHSHAVEDSVTSLLHETGKPFILGMVASRGDSQLGLQTLFTSCAKVKYSLETESESLHS